MFLIHPAAVFAQSIEARCWVENENVVGAALTGYAPSTSELSTIILPTTVYLKLEILRYLYVTDKLCYKMVYVGGILIDVHLEHYA